MSNFLSDFRLGTLLTQGFIALLISINISVTGQNQFDLVSGVLESKRQILGGNVCLLIFKDNHMIFGKKLGSYKPDTPEMIASCSKWLTAALVATFIDERKISPDDTIGKFLPVFSKAGKGKITIGQCLSHTTGIESEPITFRMLLARRKFSSLAEEVNSFAEKKMSGKPGEVFCYGNIGLNIAGRILELISHKDFETLFQDRIAIPLGMKKTTFKKGNSINPSGGAVSTASDYMNFLQMILRKGNFRGHQIINPKTIDMMQLSRTKNVKVVYSPAEASGFEYGWGEWILEKDKAGKTNVVSSPGLFGTYPWIDIKRNYAAIVFVKNIRFKDRQKNYLEIREAVNEAVMAKY